MVVEGALGLEVHHVGEEGDGELAVGAENLCAEGGEVFDFVALVPLRFMASDWPLKRSEIFARITSESR